MSQQQYDDISLVLWQKDLQGYSSDTFRADLIAGLTVALVAMPQAMAHSLIAGVPLSCGLLSAVFATLIAAVFGSSRHLVVGTNNAIAILIQQGTAGVLFTYYRDISGSEREAMAIQILTLLAILVGAFQIFVAVCRLGRLTQFVSYSVIMAYLAGTAFMILVTQLYTFLGVQVPIDLYSLYERTVYLVTHFKKMHIPTAIIGACSLLLLILFKKITPKAPAGVFMLIIIGVSVHFLGLSSYSSGIISLDPEGIWGKVPVVGDTGELQQLIPVFQFPFFHAGVVNQLLPIAFAIALLSTLETTAVAKGIAANTGQRLAINQEIFGLGLANLFCSLIGAMPCAGSPSRSSLLYNSGGKTRFSVICSAAFVGLIVMVLGFFVTRVPLPALAAILLVSATNIVNLKQFFVCLKATRSDQLVISITFLACLLLSLDVAFYIGIIISISLYLTKAAVPQLVECTFDENGRVKSLDHNQKKETSIRLINVQGELFFGAADLFQSTLKSLAEDDTTTCAIILRLKNARDLDATACLALLQLHAYLKGSGRHLLACDLSHQSWDVMCHSGIIEEIGKENLFLHDDKNPTHSLQRAVWQAKELIRENKELISPIKTSIAISVQDRT